jgi:hypothetical protein
VVNVRLTRELIAIHSYPVSAFIPWSAAILAADSDAGKMPALQKITIQFLKELPPGLSLYATTLRH